MSTDINQRDLMQSFNLPTKYSSKEKKKTYFQGLDTTAIKDNLRIFDQMQFMSRFKWHNLPEGITSEDIERILYFRGSGMLYLDKDLDKFFFLPYAMTSDSITGEEQPTAGATLSFTGKYRKIKPMSFNGESSADAAAVNNGMPPKGASTEDVYLGLIVKNNITDIPNILEMDDKQIEHLIINGAVCFYDYTPALSQTITSRSRLSAAFISEMENVIVNLKAAMLNSTGFNLFSTEDPAGAELLQLQLDAITQDRHRGQVSGAVSSAFANAKNLQSNAPAAMREFFNAFEQWDAMRKSMMGIEAGTEPNGTQYNNIAEITMGASATRQVYLNGFFERIKSAAIANMIWGTNIYPDPVLLTGMSFNLETAQGAAQVMPQPATQPANAGETEGGN